VSEHRQLSRISGPKLEEIREEWRKMRREELHNFYFSPYVIRVITALGMI
jgi:hypothetical protein